MGLFTLGFLIEMGSKIKVPQMVKKGKNNNVELSVYCSEKSMNSKSLRRNASQVPVIFAEPMFPVDGLNILTQAERCPVENHIPFEETSRKKKLPKRKDYEDKREGNGELSRKVPLEIKRNFPTDSSKGVSPRITLLLDVDETLVHSTMKKNGAYDVKLNVQRDEFQVDVFVKFRPFLFEFLNTVADLFEVIIFTASHSSYCNQLMDYVDPKNKLGKQRLHREHCTRHRGIYVKDLWQLGRPLDRVALLDNSHSACLFQPRNLIPIPAWFDDPNDRALRDILPFLRILSASDSVYNVLDEHKSFLHNL